LTIPQSKNSRLELNIHFFIDSGPKKFANDIHFQIAVHLFEQLKDKSLSDLAVRLPSPMDVFDTFMLELNKLRALKEKVELIIERKYKPFELKLD
jgi:hypothetical protein